MRLVLPIVLIIWRAIVSANPVLEDIIRPLATAAAENKITQCDIGACHLFALQNMFEDATGKKVSLSRLFAEHMLYWHTRFVDKELLFIAKQRKTIAQLSSNLWPGEKLPLEDIERIRKETAMHEGGNFYRGLYLLQRKGGVLVDDNKDWMEKVMPATEKLKRERALQITHETPLDKDTARHRLFHNGVFEMAFLARPVPEEKAEEVEAVKEAANNIQMKPIISLYEAFFPKFITDTEISNRKHRLIAALQESAIFASVNLDTYHLIAYDPNPLTSWNTGLMFPWAADHAVVIAGYKAATDTFLVLDSNRPGVLEIRANDLVRTTFAATGFEKRPPPKGYKYCYNIIASSI